MTTFAEMKARVVRLGGSEVEITEDTGITYGSDYTAELLAEAISAAMDAILPWVWCPSIEAITGAALSHALPANLYSVEAIWDETLNTYITPAILAPGQPTATESGNSWIQYPNGYVTFYDEIGDDGGKLYYASVWTKPSTESGELSTPIYANNGIAFYAAGYALTRRSVEAASIRQFATRVDSGTPEHNPLKDMAQYMFKMFDIEMSRMPNMVKGVR
jgi:hypothetical protein